MSILKKVLNGMASTATEATDRLTKFRQKQDEKWQKQDEEKTERERKIQVNKDFQINNRPQDSLYTESASYFGGHPNYTEFNRHIAGKMHLSNKGVHWINYPNHIYIPYHSISDVRLESNSSSSFGDLFAFTSAARTEDQGYKTMMIINCILDNVSHDVIFNFSSGFARGMSAENAQNFVSKMAPFRKNFNLNKTYTATSEM